MDNDNININYKRLLKHFKANQKGYDEVALLDLSHCLRIWMDMKKLVDERLLQKDHKIRFKSYTVSKQLSRLINNKEYVIAGLPDGINTWAGNTEIFSSTKYPLEPGRRGAISGEYILGTMSMMTKNGISVAQVIFILNKSSPPNNYVKIINNGLPVTSYKFLKWLNSEIVRVSYFTDNKKLERRIIPREIFVNRVANILGGSHPVGLQDSQNQFNDAIKHLMGIKTCGLPTPYFLIMKVAKDILDKTKVLVTD